MGFPAVITAPQKVTLRTSNYWQATFIGFNPGETVFQCRANEDITDAPFKEFAWDGAAVGAYTDVWAGMVVYISDTATPFKDYKYRGRVAAAPSATVFQIDLNATILADGDYITVIRDADLFAKIRQDTLIDSRHTYHNLPPMTTGLPSVLVLYDSDNDGSVLWTPAQSGIAVASGATISSYAWAISGTGSSSVSNAAAQNPNFTFDAGFHYLVRLTTTDSNGVTNFIIVQVYAITRTFTAPVILPAAAGDVHQDLDNGYSGSITAYGGVANLPYRTHAAVFCVEHFGDNSSTPIVTNILMHGRLRSESITTEGSDEGGALQQVTYPIEGITSYMQRLKMPNDMVRHNAAPNAWGEITNPTPYRMAVYALYAYTTLLNLVSFSAGDALFDAWRRGGDPVSVDGGYALDVLTTLLAFVDAAPNYAPDGEIRCEINASNKVDRSGLVTVMDFLVNDLRSFTLDIDASRVTGQVMAYGGAWNTVNNSFDLYTASAPTIPYGDAPETREYTRAVMQHDSTVAEAITELKARAGNDFAVNNPKWLINPVMRDSHRWMVATNYQRYTFTLAATYNLREIALTADTRFQCQAVDITINADGTYDVAPQFVEETEFSDAQAIASLLPNNLEGMNPVLPILSDDPAFPDDPLWMFPTDTPTADEQPATDPYSAYLMFSPWTPDQAAQAAQQQGTTTCKPLQVNFKNASNVQTDWSTVNGAGYTVKATGFAKISGGIQTLVYPTIDSLPSNITINGGLGTFVPGTGIVGDIDQLAEYPRLDGGGDDYAVRVDVDVALPDTVDLVAVRLYTRIIAPDTGDGGFADIYVPAAIGFEQEAQGLQTYEFVLADTINSFQAIFDLGYTDLAGSVNYESAVIHILGIEVDIDLGEDLYGDAFYSFLQSPDSIAQVYGALQGLRINSTAVSPVPPYNPTHEYTFPYTGDGNPFIAGYADTDHTDNSSNLLDLLICRNP